MYPRDLKNWPFTLVLYIYAMVVDERIRLLFPRILSFVVIGAAIGTGYGYETSITDATGLRGLIRGALTGVLIGAAVNSLSAFVLQARPRLRSDWARSTSIGCSTAW